MRIRNKMVALALACIMTVSTAVVAVADEAPAEAEGAVAVEEVVAEPGAGEEVQLASPGGQTEAKPEKLVNQECTNTGSTVSTREDGTAIVKVAYQQPDKTTVKTQLYAQVKGVKYKVTRIYTNAYKNHKKTKAVIVRKGVTQIDKNAFKNSTGTLKTVRFERLNAPTFAKGALAGIKTVKLPKGMTKSQLKRYKDRLKAAGFTGTIVVDK